MYQYQIKQGYKMRGTLPLERIIHHVYDLYIGRSNNALNPRW